MRFTFSACSHGPLSPGSAMPPAASTVTGNISGDPVALATQVADRAQLLACLNPLVETTQHLYIINKF